MGQIVHAVALIGLDQVVHQHGIHQGALHPNAIVQQDLVVVLQVVTDLFNGRIFERTAQGLQQGHGFLPVCRKRHVIGGMRLVGKSNADQLRLQSIQGSGLCVKAKRGLLRQFARKKLHGYGMV